MVQKNIQKKVRHIHSFCLIFLSLLSVTSSLMATGPIADRDTKPSLYDRNRREQDYQRQRGDQWNGYIAEEGLWTGSGAGPDAGTGWSGAGAETEGSNYQPSQSEENYGGADERSLGQENPGNPGSTGNPGNTARNWPSFL